MKDLTFRLNFPGIIRIILMIFMLSNIINLFGDEMSWVNECPLHIDFEVVFPDGTDKFGTNAEFTYTITIDTVLATEFDKQRTYSFFSEFFSSDKKCGSLIPLSSDMKNGDTFTYSQFPITRHLTIRVDEGPVEFIFIIAKGYKVEGCPDEYYQDGDKFIQQESLLIMTHADYSGDDDDGTVPIIDW